MDDSETLPMPEHNIHVLYVDDDIGLARLLQKKLTRAGFDVTLAESGNQALSLLPQLAVDIVVTDYRMPDGDGMDLLRGIATQHLEVPVIMLSAMNDLHVAVEALKQGAADYLVKETGNEFLELLPQQVQRVWQQKRLMLELARERALIRDAVECLEQGICLLDNTFRIDYCNQQFLAMLGAPDALSKRGTPLGALAAYIAQRGTDGPSHPIYAGIEDTHRLLRTGTRLERSAAGGGTLEMTAQPLPAGGYAITLTDITARKHYETQILQQSEALAAANRAKSQFLANISHELRTPLNSILPLANMLKSNRAGNLTLKQVEICDVITQSSRALVTMIDEILDLSQIETGQLSVKNEAFRLRELCTQLQQAFTAQADSRQLRYTVTVQPDTPEFMLSDRFRVYQVLSQLISNAFKFTKQGAVNVLVRQVGAPLLSDAVNSIAPKNFIEFAVTDTGCGVAVSELEHIFQVFEQADSSNTRQHGGMGLGLSISKRLAELLGGSLGVESETGKGSTFTLWLPLSPRPQCLQ